MVQNERLHMRVLHSFWEWYDRNFQINLVVAAGLFALQLLHLTWLALHVIALRLMGDSLFPTSPFFTSLLVAVDYTEIPALISSSLLYAHEFRQGFRRKSVLFLTFINAQWLHLFWITDEFLMSSLIGGREGTILPVWLAWIAIFIDYLELPVVADTIVKVVQSGLERRLKVFLQRGIGYNFWRK